MQKSYGVMPAQGFVLSVGKFEATIGIGKRTSGQKAKDEVAYLMLSTPGLYKSSKLGNRKQKVMIERVLTVTVPLSKAYKKKFTKCFKALEQGLDKEKAKVRMLPIKR